MEEKMKKPDEMHPEKKEKTISDGETGSRSLLVIDGITVHEVYRENGKTLWECLLSAMGRM
ncbi:MAG: hypothetical protein LUE16_00165 [Lachnospiraceae bacterium]|nr:hypothetical protein [Lachnospiraceae bacterium]